MQLTTGKEAKILQFLAPFFICVCVHFDGDVEIVAVLYDHFALTPRHGKKAVFIVEAKMNDIQLGMAQDLVGCEVAAQLGHLDVVHGIVTDYIYWNFLCNSNEKIELEEQILDATKDGPEPSSLEKIIGKIYGMVT